jgi:hypothetical protein
MAKGFKKDGKFIPTDKSISGVKKRILETNPEVPKVDNTELMKEKATPEISRARVSSLSDGELKKTVAQVNGIFSGQTNYLQKNNNEFDERVTKENHEKTLDALNMLIEEAEQRKLLKETKKKRNDYSIDGDEDDEEQEIDPDFAIGDIVMVSTDNDNEGYNNFRNKKLRITHVAVNRDEHQGFDEGVGMALYDLETLDGKAVGSSLYDYELESA